MVLPLLFGLLGSGLASSGMLGGIGALTAGAIGTGLGSAIESGDIGEGVASGLLSFFGGKFIGDALGAAPLTGAGAAAADAGVNAALNTTTSQAATEAAKAAATDAAGKGLTGMFSGMLTDPTKAMLNTPGALGPSFLGKNMTGGIGAMTSPQIFPYVAGAQAPGLLGLSGGLFGNDGGLSGGSSNYRKAPAPGKITRTPPPGYRPGIDPEFDYRVPIYGVQYMAEGGQVDIQSAGDKKIISDAVAAIRGEIEDPRIPLGIFLRRFGQEALSDLIDEVQSGGMAVEDGAVSGVGDGVSDDVPASTPDGGDVALSDGEFVIPADVVSHLGNGSTDAGSRRLQDMMNRVRAARTGTPASPEPIDPRMMVPA